MQKRENLALIDNTCKSIKNNKKSLLENFAKGCVFNGCAEFRHISALVVLNGNNSSIGFSRVNVFLEQSLDTRGMKRLKTISILIKKDNYYYFFFVFFR